MVNTKKRYEDILRSGKIKDDNKRDTIKKMVNQLDDQIMTFDSIMKGGTIPEHLQSQE